MAERSTKKTYFYVLVTLLLLIFFHYLGWFNLPEKLARQIMSGTLSKINVFSVSLKKDNSAVDKKPECQTEYEQILFWQKENEMSVAHLRILEQENNELKKVLNFSQKQPSYKVLTATVVGKNTENTERVIAISSGLDSGIKVGQPVVVLDGIIIGKIIRVEQNISWVRLINDSNSKIAAVILNKESSQGVVEGGYGLSVNMNFIPRNEQVTASETVVTSGLDPDVPKGLLLGTVAAVINEAYQPFQKAILNPATDLSKITVVGVIAETNL